MRKISYSRIRGNNRVKHYVPFKRSYSIRTAVIGLFLSVPFVIDSIILSNGHHQMTFFPTLFVIGFVVGAPMVLVGLVSFDGSSTSSSSDSIELKRIRYAAEQEMRKK